MLGAAFEADDAVQETMLRAWKAAEAFEGRSSLRSWLYRIATNLCPGALRREKRRALPMDLGPASPPVESYMRPQPAEDLWVTPIPDSRVVPDHGDPAEIAAVRDGAAAPPGAAAGSADPVRGAQASRRGSRQGPGQHRGLGEQRAAAGAHHPRGPAGA